MVRPTVAALGIAAALTMALASAAKAQGWNPPAEPRAAWVYVGRGSNFSKTDGAQGRRDVQALIDKLARAHVNLVFPWVRSDYAVALEDPKYRQYEPCAGWDSLGEVVRAARAKGMQVHLWYAFTEDKGRFAPEYDPAHGGDPSWAAIRISEIQPDANGQVKPKLMSDVCPNHPQVRQWEINMISHLLDRYPQFSGVHIEEPGYTAYSGECVCDVCQQLFQQNYHMDLISNFKSKQVEDLRGMGTTAFMRQLRASLKHRDPNLALSCNGGYSWTEDHQFGRFWRDWARMGIIDFFCSQIYAKQINRFDVMAKRVIGDLSPLPVLAGVGTDWSHTTGPNEANDAATIVQEIQDARGIGAKGIALFYGQGLTEEHVSAIAAGPFASIASLGPPDTSGGGGSNNAPSPTPVPSATNQDITVVVNGSPVAFSGTGPVMLNNRVLVPLRGVFERLRATVLWTPRTQSVSAKRGRTTVRLTIGSQTATVNGQPVSLDVPPIILGSRTLVPIRFISEALGARVSWDGASSTVRIAG